MTKAYLDSDIREIAERLGSRARAFEDRTVLISGAAGFLGIYFLALFGLLNRDYLRRPARVIGLDSFIVSHYGDTDLGSFPGVEVRAHDVTRPIEIAERPDFVLHVAGIASPVWYKTYPLETLDVSTLGTRNMLEVAHRCGARFLNFSSSEIYGDPDAAHVPTPEDYRGNVSSLGGRACYDEGKRVGETLCDIFHRHHGLDVVQVRPFNVFGPGLAERDYRVLPNFASRLKAGLPLEVYGTGEQTRTFCYVTDAVTGFMQVLIDGAPGEVYNIGNPDPEITIRELARIVADITDADVVHRVVAYPEGYPREEPLRRCPDIRKAATQCGFAPIVSLREGLIRFFAWADAAYQGAPAPAAKVPGDEPARSVDGPDIPDLLGGKVRQG